jgi:hypothetical protein
VTVVRFVRSHLNIVHIYEYVLRISVEVVASTMELGAIKAIIEWSLRKQTIHILGLGGCYNIGIGFRMIALLVGTISKCIRDDWFLKDKGVLPALGEALKSKRDDYMNLELWLKDLNEPKSRLEEETVNSLTIQKGNGDVNAEGTKK